MAKFTSVSQPPFGLSPDLYDWAQEVTDALNEQPIWSQVSLSNTPNDSGYTGSKGDLLINVGSHASRFWINASGTTSSWSHINFG